MISGLIKLFDSSDSITCPINIGNPSEFTILELARQIINVTDSRSEIVYKELPLDDPKQRKPDISQATMLLNWNPVVPLSLGINNTVSELRQRI
jgi:UDP-glucuronate decarboxylase